MPHKGYKQTPEHVEAHAAALRGRKQTAEEIEARVSKLRGGKKPPQTPEHIEARAEQLRGRVVSSKVISKRIETRRKNNGGGWGRTRPVVTPEILWSKVDKRGPKECWPWLGNVSDKGYGRISIDGKTYGAHRVIYNLANTGVINLRGPKHAKGMGLLRHTCDNPICCNPSHLLVGTHQDNMDDMESRGRRAKPNAMFSDDQVRTIRQQKKSGMTINELAQLNGCSRTAIEYLLNGRTYSDVL